MNYLLILLTIATSYSQNLKLVSVSELKSYEFYGSIQPKHQSKLSSLVEGQVSTRHVEIGDIVQKNQALYSLDFYPQNFELKSIKVERERLKNQLKFLKLKLSRREKNEDAYTEETVEEVQLQVTDKILQLQSINIKISLLQETLDKKVIKAPYAGVILDYYKDMGDFTTIASPLLSMMSVKDQFLRVSINRLQARQLYLQQKVSIVVGNQSIVGRVIRIHANEDENHMRNVDVLMNTKEQFVANQVLKVTISLNKALIKIPKEFIKSIHGVTTVKVIDQGSRLLKEVHGDFKFDNFVTENLSLEGLELERF